MRIRYFFSFFFFFLLFSFTKEAFVAGVCKIDNGPIPELAQYIQSVDVRLKELQSKGNLASNCGKTPGSLSSNFNQTIETLDRTVLEIPIMDNMFLDFRYNITLAINGETRSPVLRDGALFNQVERKITGALAGVTSRCNLTSDVKSGFVSLIQENQILEDTFKKAALGTPDIPTGLSEANMQIAKAINRDYVKTATESCKNQNNFQDVFAKLTKAIESIGTKNEGALSDWKKAIALFQGGAGMTTEEYTTTQRKLLQAELSRQGLSSRMTETILKNFDCVKKETISDDSASAVIRAKFTCLSNPILGLENFTLLPFKKSINTGKNLDDRLDKVNQLSNAEKITKDITKRYYETQTLRASNSDTKVQIMNDLINLHISLLSTAESVEKRLPAMYANCMKAQPGISCPRP